MASFCNQCSKDMGFEPGDFANLTTTDDEAYGWACWALCEGCGPIQVDSKGNCISLDCLEKGHVQHQV